MNNTARKTMSEMETKYHEITELFSLAEELASTVDNPFTLNKEQQMELVEPLIDTIADSADVLTDEFIAVCEGKAAKRKPSTARIETAMRKIYIAMHDYSAQAKKLSHGLANIADPVVEKIKRQMETVVANFMEFVKLSLDRIMQKHEIDEMKQRHERISLMLHAQAIGQGT